MAKVLVIGGIFFKSQKLYQWYERWLGFRAEPGQGSASRLRPCPRIA
ncbi:MAG: hypothetical protein U0401_14510 [Anaerolineae bacterium]